MPHASCNSRKPSSAKKPPTSRQFEARLGTAPSNVPDLGNGAGVYETYVKGMQVDLEQVGAHYAISSVFTSYPDQTDLFCFTVRAWNTE